MRIAPDVDAAPVVVDKRRVERIIVNLLDNAQEHGQGQIRVTAERVPPASLRIAIEDEGTGITPEDRERIFERFARGQGAEPGGSGLGLALVRESAQAAGGEAVAETSLSGGLRVTTSWPAAHR